MASSGHVVIHGRSRPGYAGALGLDRRARHRAVGAEHAAIAGLGPQHHAAARACVDDPACVGRHVLNLGSATSRASDDGVIDHDPYSAGTAMGCPAPCSSRRACRMTMDAPCSAKLAMMAATTTSGQPVPVPNTPNAASSTARFPSTSLRGKSTPSARWHRPHDAATAIRMTRHLPPRPQNQRRPW